MEQMRDRSGARIYEVSQDGIFAVTFLSPLAQRGPINP
jgi:hypothetical protein